MDSLDVKTDFSDNPHVTTGEDSGERDRVDARVDRWATEIPGLDVPTEAIAQRISMLEHYLDKGMGKATAPFGLGVGEYKVLTVLRGSGEPYRMSPSKLAEYCNLSTGAMTNRLDNLERDGLVQRLPDPDDRRSLQVELTEKGAGVWQQIAEVAADREKRVTATLDTKEKAQLNALLRRLVLSFERELGPLKK
jgi:DNA-binding MarR family transcriptional regulator